MMGEVCCDGREVCCDGGRCAVMGEVCCDRREVCCDGGMCAVMGEVCCDGRSVLWGQVLFGCCFEWLPTYLTVVRSRWARCDWIENRSVLHSVGWTAGSF